MARRNPVLPTLMFITLGTGPDTFSFGFFIDWYFLDGIINENTSANMRESAYRLFHSRSSDGPDPLSRSLPCFSPNHV